MPDAVAATPEPTSPTTPEPTSPARAPARVAPLVGPRRPLVGPRPTPGLAARLLAGRRVVTLLPRLLVPVAALLTAGVLTVGLASDRPDVAPVDGLPAADPGAGATPELDGLPEPMVRPTGAFPSGADARVDPTLPVRPLSTAGSTTPTPTGSATSATPSATGAPTATPSATPTDVTSTEPTGSGSTPTPTTTEPTEPTSTAPAGVTVVIEIPLPFLGGD